MNYVDHNFNWLMQELKEKTKEEVFMFTKEQYLALPTTTKDAIESFLGQFGYWGKLDFKNDEFESLHNRARSLKEHQSDYEWLYEHLTDYRSKKLLFAILYNWYAFDSTVLSELMDQTFCHYFDLDLIQPKNEVFVDVGAYTGDSTMDWIQSYGVDAYQKIYCYEMTPETVSTLTKNLSSYPNIVIRPCAVGEQNGTLAIKTNQVDQSANCLEVVGEETIPVVPLDEDLKEKITMIKMDIEGMEMQALKGARRHIQEDHPTLLISVYHNHEDLWQIPKLIAQLDPNYDFALRFYGSAIFPTEIVLFALPK